MLSGGIRLILRVRGYSECWLRPAPVLRFHLSALGILKRGEKDQQRVVRLESENDNLLVQFVRPPILSSQALLRCLYEISSIIDSPIRPSSPT
jgi:hypothetical protein